MDDGLIHRNNIVRTFADNLDKFSIDSKSSTTSEMVYICEDSNLKIKKNNETNEFTFSMLMKFTVLEDLPFDASPVGFRNNKIPVNYTSVVDVMKFSNGAFSVINAGSNNEWVESTYVPVRDTYGTIVGHEKGIITKLNTTYKVLPDSEESHFQRITTDGLVLELDECMMVYEIVNKIMQLGSLVQATPDIQAHLYF
jgi:hypothetical protein